MRSQFVLRSVSSCAISGTEELMIDVLISLSSPSRVVIPAFNLTISAACISRLRSKAVVAATRSSFSRRNMWKALVRDS